MDDHGSSLSLAIISSADYIPGLPLTRPPVAGHFKLGVRMRHLRDVDGAISKYDACSNLLTRSLSPQISDADQGRTTVLRASRFRISTAARASYFGLALDGVADTLLRRIVCAAVAMARVILLY